MQVHRAFINASVPANVSDFHQCCKVPFLGELVLAHGREALRALAGFAVGNCYLQLPGSLLSMFDKCIANI